MKHDKSLQLLQEIARCMFPVSYNEGDMIITEGTTGDMLYALQGNDIVIMVYALNGDTLSPFSVCRHFVRSVHCMATRDPITHIMSFSSQSKKVWVMFRVAMFLSCHIR